MAPLVCAVSTARAGSKSVPNKNLYQVRGKSLYLHNVLEAMQCSSIAKTYVSTDIPQVLSDAQKHGFQIIIRPSALCQDNSTHDETILHALLAIEEDIGEQLDYLVVMLGNTINMRREVVEEAIEILTKEDNVDSVVTVIRANHFNPIRAYVAKGELLDTFLPQDEIARKQHDLSDKNAIGNIYFQNGLWILRRATIIRNDGILPFKWFGKNVRWIEQDAGLQEVDDVYQLRLL